jgi:hypothetical protein
LTAQVVASDASELSPGDSEEQTSAGFFSLQSVRDFGKHPDITGTGAEGVVGVLLGSGGNQHSADDAGVHHARTAAPIKRVEVAIMQVSTGTCRWVRSLGARFTPKRSTASCDAPAWLPARGTDHWKLEFARRLPKGRYDILARAVDARGHASSTFSRRAHTESVLTVK